MGRPEDERVKIPALMHLTRLGYTYFSFRDREHDEDTNIFPSIFREALSRINHRSLSEEDISEIIREIRNVLDSDDLGRGFFKLLQSGYKGINLIDYSSPDNNSWHVVTELPCINGQDEFRPDITLLINGMPLVFIEVKRPNNAEGIQAERDRMDKRLQNRRFRRFIHMTQFMIFSNNSEYDDAEMPPLSGAFYATIGKARLFFNHFREEDESIFQQIRELDPEVEDTILLDTHLPGLRHHAEYATNLSPTTPTHKILSSMVSRERLLFLLHYGLVYVDRVNDNGITVTEKHIMRYPQIFATKAIERRLSEGARKGIIWHTQGSGKTALAFFNVKFLTDYYQRQGVVARFYFIVDRLDLLEQAAIEFRARGLVVNEVNTKNEFKNALEQDRKSGNTGELSITVVNIQKFSPEAMARPSDYDIHVQRVYFLDEAHRSYDPRGSFLSYLQASDRQAVMIALTGTPLIGVGYNSKDVFGPYIHKYYYNASIRDGYTLRLIREGIKTEYRLRMINVLESIHTLERSVKREDLYAHRRYVEEMLKYILEDFRMSRIRMNDPSIGGMIVCDSSKQAREVFRQMKDLPDLKAALILHDEDDIETRKQERKDFKDGNIDILIVFNMLLTGFDASRLKRLYMGRVIRDHNLLQALTRVNRPYGRHRYGYVIDFADIRAEFDKTNREYLQELQAELGDAFTEYDSIFMTEEEIEGALDDIKETLFLYDQENISVFTQQISDQVDKAELLRLRKALVQYRELFNVARLFGYEALASAFTVENASAMLKEVEHRIQLVNLQQTLTRAEDMEAVLNIAMNEIEFVFRRVATDEMVIADSYRETMEKTREAMHASRDPEDPEYITLLEELRRLLQKKNIEELTADEMREDMTALDGIRKRAADLNRRDAMLAQRYGHDDRFMRIHKRLRSGPLPIGSDMQIYKLLMSLKRTSDERVLLNSGILRNEPYFIRALKPDIYDSMQAGGLPIDPRRLDFVAQTISREYFRERTWTS